MNAATGRPITVAAAIVEAVCAIPTLAATIPAIRAAILAITPFKPFCPNLAANFPVIFTGAFVADFGKNFLTIADFKAFAGPFIAFAFFFANS